MESRFKVAQIGSRGIPGHRGGVERVVEAVAPRLAARGHDVTVYCASWSREKAPTWRGVTLKYVPSVKSKHLDTLLRSFVATLGAMFGPADILHYHGSGSAPLAALARLAGKKVVVTVHGADWARRKWGALGRWFLQFGEWAALKIPHQTIVVGPDLKSGLDRIYGTDTLFIPNGTEERPKRPAKAILDLGLAARGYVLFLARLVPEKQCHTLIEAWMSLKDKGDLKLAIAGPVWHSVEYAASLKEQAKDDPSVLFLGEVSEEILEELYSNCISYVLPSEVEGMSLSLLDAMAFGACIICSDIPANAYVVSDAGLTFPAGDVGALRARLQEVISDPAHAQHLRDAALRRINNEFSWDQIAQRWEEAYRRVMVEGARLVEVKKA
ncbi:glycosyltransferase family 4 protein [Dongia deserti]|uniref:glycosyltransferase family 4 protein n=1 Tax=Dongia deserti TaxID=2268030 RepID=UPI000E64C568|nr:glycosyltransferase family 4 protein [Dongia deserti]